MSWVEKVKNGLIITTGDGKKWTPLYVPNAKSHDYNYADFDFVEIDGTLVKRKKVRGSKHTLIFVFQGEDHLDEMLDFEQSAKDERPWKLSHPMFGELLVHPLSMTLDPTAFHSTRITVDVMETITDEYPKITINPISKIASDVDYAKTTSTEYFANTSTLNAKTLNTIKNDVSKCMLQGTKTPKSSLQALDYLNKFNNVNSKILFGIAGVSEIGTAVMDFLTFPGQFVSSIEIRLELLKEQFLTLSKAINNLITPDEKKVYQFQASAVVLALLDATLYQQEGDFNSSSDVLGVIDIISNIYSEFVDNIDLLQSDNGGTPDGFVPDYETILSISTAFDYTVSQLFNTALTSKKERIVFLDAASNVVQLAHRFYGLKPDDSTIQNLMNQNNIGLNEMLRVEKGRKIVYYV